jgi:hypothetical protein
MKVLFDLIVKPTAYLDPGSGSMLIQILLATLLGAGVAIRIFWRNIKAFFSGKKAGEASVADPTEVIEDDPTAVPSDSISAKE